MKKKRQQEVWGKNLIVFEINVADKIRLNKAGWSHAKIRACLRVSANEANESILRMMETA